MGRFGRETLPRIPCTLGRWGTPENPDKAHIYMF
jgi:hypothetical protein